MKAATKPTASGAEAGSTPRRPVVRRASLHEPVAERLRQIVARGDIAAGERLNEAAIADAFGVSRTPLREAIKLLAAEGLLELLPGRGARVRLLSPDEIVDIFEVIGALESHAVECCVLRLTPRTLAEIEQLHARMVEQHGRHDMTGYFNSNQKMHALLVRLAASPKLETTHAVLSKTARFNRDATLTSDERWAESVAEHEEIIAAIRAGSAAKARALMLDHARRTGAALARIARRAASAPAATGEPVAGGEPPGSDR
ncbi:MAG: GntR family transcriptional regulator [Ancalomicrobiaceae bacterium]|nr:GntR family transcriptional regulator [Ancalomicrobiaceae bacterium]